MFTHRSLSIYLSVSAVLTDLLPEPYVGLSVGWLVRKVYCGNIADWIWMLFEVVSGVG